MATTCLYTFRRGRKNVYVRIDTDIKGKETLVKEAVLDVISVKLDNGSTSFVLLDEEGNSNPSFHPNL